MIPIRDNIPCKTAPLISWSIIAICTCIFIFLKMLPEEIHRQIIYLYGMVPVRYSNPEWATAFGLPYDGHFSFLSSIFLHSGWLHIIINMWFLWIFSKNIEAKMGHINFLFFYLVCGLVATFTQWYFDPELIVPVVGASGAVAGILGAYFFLFPYARIVIWLPLLFLPIFFELPAIAFLGFWVIIQIQNATTSILFDGVTASVAWWAHIGGFIAGGFLHPLFIKAKKTS